MRAGSMHTPCEAAPSGTRGRALRLGVSSVNLLLALSALPFAATQTDQLALVESPEQLQTAVRIGARHIVILQHLNLTTLGPFTGSGERIEVILPVSRATWSIRVRPPCRAGTPGLLHGHAGYVRIASGVEVGSACAIDDGGNSLAVSLTAERCRDPSRRASIARSPGRASVTVPEVPRLAFVRDAQRIPVFVYIA
jgi:hypothetical protein